MKHGIWYQQYSLYSVLKGPKNKIDGPLHEAPTVSNEMEHLFIGIIIIF